MLADTKKADSRRAYALSEDSANLKPQDLANLEQNGEPNVLVGRESLAGGVQMKEDREADKIEGGARGIVVRVEAVGQAFKGAQQRR